MERKFKVGDRVECIADMAENIPLGTKGEVISTPGYERTCYIVNFEGIMESNVRNNWEGGGYQMLPSEIKLIEPKERFTAYRYKPTSEEDFDKVVAEREDMGYKKTNNTLGWEDFKKYKDCDCLVSSGTEGTPGDLKIHYRPYGVWHNQTPKEYFPKYKEKTGPKYIPAETGDWFEPTKGHGIIDSEGEDKKEFTLLELKAMLSPLTPEEIIAKKHAEFLQEEYKKQLSSRQGREKLMTFGKFKYDLLNPKQTKKMTNLRENIWNRFIKNKSDKIADLVESIEEASSVLKAYPSESSSCIRLIENAIDDENKKEVERLYKELKQWGKIYKSPEYFALVNSQQVMEDLIEKTFKTK